MEFLTDFPLIVSLVIGVVLHEYAHAKVAYWWGDNTPKLAGRLTLNPLKHLDIWGTLAFIFFKIGWAKPVPVDFSLLRLKGIVAPITTLLAGPAMNLLLTLVALVLLSVSNVKEVFLLQFSFINFALALFNLLPFPPLDGGKALFLLLNRQYVDIYRLSDYERYGIIALLVFLLLFSEIFFGLVTRLWVNLSLLFIS